MTRIIVAVDSAVFVPLISDYLATMPREQFVYVKVIHALEPSEFNEGSLTDTNCLEAKNLIGSTVRTLRKRCPQISFDAVLAKGHADEVILDHAEAWRADIIILGSHGRRGVNRFLLGSVSAAVSAHAHCSVIIMRTSGNDANCVTGSNARARASAIVGEIVIPAFVEFKRTD